MICPNKSLNEWKELEDHFGENVAESLFHRNDGVIPTIEEAAYLLKGSKIAQFKKTLGYLGTTTSNSVQDLLPHLFRIVQKVGNDLFVVKGSAINEKPAPGTEFEVHQANVKFLNAVNEQYGPLFNLEQILGPSEREKNSPTVEALRQNLLDDIKKSEAKGLSALTLKGMAENPQTQDEAIKELVDQARGGTSTKRELEKAVGESIVEKALRYYELFTAKPEEITPALSENKTGATQGFFSDVVTGISEKFKPTKPYKPILSFSKDQFGFKKAFDSFKGKFDEHIATSIPTFRDLQIKVGSTLSNMYKGTGGLVYDIGGSEGGFVKAISKVTGGKVKGINLDVNESMKSAHEATPVSGAEFVNEAFLEPYTEGEKTYPRHVPTQKADVVHESMVFQFISPERAQFVKELKQNYLKEDGIALLEEKVLPGTEEEWKQNEQIKDKYKLQYYPQEALTQKAEQVLVGMKQNQTMESDLVNVLKDNFAHVGQYWDSGNFKGYIATDSKVKFDEFLAKVGDTNSEYSSRSKDSFVKIEDKEQIAGPEIKGPKSEIVPTPGTHKVTIDQSALDKIAADNAALKPKEDAFEREESLDSNKKILTDKAPRYSKAEEDIAVTTVQYNTLNNLKSKFNLPYEVVNDETLPWKGKFENGKVYINAAKVNEYTPVHEYLHPYMMVMGKDNPELYNRLVEELQSTEEGKKTIEEVKKQYPELAARDQFEEALVSHISKLVRSDEIKSKPWYQTFIDWFRNLFAKNNVSITDLDLNSSIRDIADKIIDPTYSADLKKYGEFNDTAVRFEKDLNADNRADRFQAVLGKIKNKLKLDVNITPKTKEEEQRKYFSGRQLKALEEGDDVYHAINDYVVSSIINAKKVSEQFDGFKEFYEKRNGNLSKEEMLQGFQTLAQMEQQVVLYNESRLVVDAIRDENPDEYEDNFKILKNRLDGDAKIMNDYHEYGLKLMADWLYPSTKKVIETAIKTGNKQKMPGYDDYLKVKADHPGLSDNEAIERGVKKWLRGQMEHATTDIGFFNSYLNGVLNSKDPISQLVALSLKEEFARNNDKLFRVKNGIKEAVNKTIGKKIFTTNAEHKKFYSQYLRQVESYERTGHDDNGNPIFGYVKRSAFHEPFNYDEYYKAKREMFQKLGVRPNKNDETAYKSWVASRDKWFDDHSVRVFNDKGELTKTVPHDRYKNPEFARVENDPLFKEIYKHYQDANGRLGKYQMKYGIIPQKSTGAGFFSDLKISKGFKGNIEEFKKHFKESVGAELGNYYAQDIDGKEFKNIPIRYTRMLEDDDLSYNLAQSVADFWESSSKYEAANKLQPMVLTLRSFIEGNSFLKIDQRDAPEIDAKGLKKMGNYVKNISKTKDQANINRQLVDFLNDTIYGESEKKANIKSPFGNLKYLVYKKGDTSANGKAHREYVYSLEDLKKKTGDEKIDYSHFEKGKDKEVGDYVVNLVQNDKILSVNKLSKKLNAASATINLGGNVIAGISHYLRGVAATFIEGTGGKYFNNANWTSAYKDYFKGLVGFDFLEDARGGKGSLISQHLTHYGTFQGEFLNEYGKHIGQGVANKLFRRSSLFFSIHGAEHMIQTTQMLAAMKHIKVEDGTGKKITLDKAWEVGKDGYRKLKDGVKWSEQQDNNFRDMIQSINKDRGNYSEFDKAAISRLWWGKMLIMFRRHIMNGIKTRWGSEYVDFERGTATQGYYRSFMTSLVSEFNDLRLNGKLHKLSPEEQYHMKKTLADVGMFIMLASVLVPAFRNEDEDKQGWDDYAALFSRRLQMDVSFFYDPLEWKKVVQSPIVTGSTVDKVYDFASQLAVSPSETYEKDGAGYVSGDNKALAKLKKLIPVYRVGMNLQDPQDLLKFYDLKKPITSGK